jgi:glutathione S-transferase
MKYWRGLHLNDQDQDKYAEVYGQYLRDEAQSDAAKAIRAGRAIP